MRAKTLLSLAFAACLALAPRTSRAEDDPRKVRAEVVFKEGVRLHTEGKNDEALSKLREAYQIYPSPNTLGGIARVEHALGKKVDALHHYREALANPLMHPENQDFAKKAVAELEAQTARVDVKGPTGLVVQLEGKEVTLPLAKPVDVEPRTVSLAGKLGDKEYVGSASCNAGTLTVIEMRIVGGSGDVTTPPGEAPHSTWHTGKTVGLVMWAGTLLAAGAGAYFTIEANRAAGDVDDLRARSADPNPCVNGMSAECATRRTAVDERDRNSNLALGSFVSAGVLAVGGAVAFLAWPKRDPQRGHTTVAPIMTGTTYGLSLGRSF